MYVHCSACKCTHARHMRPAHMSKDPRIHLHMPFTLAMVHMQHLAGVRARACPRPLKSAKQGKHRNALKTLTEAIIFTFSRYNEYI